MERRNDRTKKRVSHFPISFSMLQSLDLNQWFVSFSTILHLYWLGNTWLYHQGGKSRMKLYTVYWQEFILYIWRVAWNIQHTYVRVIIGKEGWGNKNYVWPKSISFFVAQMILCYGQLIICPNCNSSVYVYQKCQLTVFYTNLEFYGWCWTREI